MRAAHSMQYCRGRQGLDTSAHLISIRLIRVRFSGVLSIVFIISWFLSVSWNMSGIQSNQNGTLGAKPSLTGLSHCKHKKSTSQDKDLMKQCQGYLSIELGLSFYTGENQGSVIFQQDLEVEGSTRGWYICCSLFPCLFLLFLSLNLSHRCLFFSSSLSLPLGKNSKTGFVFYFIKKENELKKINFSALTTDGLL